MALRLRIVSEQRRSLGGRSSVVFGVTGGTIGRAADNDWVLPDPRRYLSGSHARIHFRQGSWHVEDLSTNGVFVNDSDRAIGKQLEQRLSDGDLLRIGDFEMLVTIDSATDFPHGESALVALDVLGNNRPVQAATQGDIGASLDLEALLVSEGSTSSSFRPVNAFGQAIAPPARRPAAEPDVDQQAEAVARRMARLTRAARAQEAAQPAALYDVQSGLAAFCRGAGIDPDRLPADAQTRMLHLAGQIVRESLLGLKDLERHHQQVRNRFRVEENLSEADAPFALGRGSIDDLVQSLLASHESRRLDAVQWVRDRYEESRSHEQAAGIAMRAAFVEFIERLDPGELETRFNRALKKGMLTGSQRAQYWDLYADFYRNLTEMPADHLPHIFVEAFARAYAEVRAKSVP